MRLGKQDWKTKDTHLFFKNKVQLKLPTYYNQVQKKIQFETLWDYNIYKTNVHIKNYPFLDFLMFSFHPIFLLESDFLSYCNKTEVLDIPLIKDVKNKDVINNMKMTKLK